jgi:hypothetical protein
MLAHAYIALLCLFGFGPLQQSTGQAGSRFSNCVSLDRAANALERVGKQDWRRIAPTTLDWPRVAVVPAEPAEQLGLHAAAERIERCCETCELCGGPVTDEAPKRTGLRMVDLWVCPRPLRSVRDSLQRLTQAVVVSSAKPTSVYRDDSRMIDGYSWISNGELFTLRADTIASDGGWIGHFQVGRCRSEDVIDTWQIDGDVTVRVTRADVQASKGKDKELWFAYFTRCLAQDRACRNTELDRLWPRLRALADRQTITRVSIDAEDCSGSSVAFSLERSREGPWKGGLWSPKKQ